uniref:NADH-ubiquinone oxidoreductase chain 5 n=1 Tax=Paromalus flavicornis TaxID=154191 RepID=A0A0S2MPE3_9COLE|nr:NADH deshydrogenase subunit 5 [Paromalus flavicornis]
MISICKKFFFLFLFISLTSFVLSLMFMINDYTMMLEYELISINSSSIYMTIFLDWMSFLFMSFVLFISSMVIYYSQGYMMGDLYIDRFIMLVCLFVLSMMLLIISPNLISILLGWDGLGLVSYCLVIYYQNVKSYNAGMLTALSNRVGDVALLMAIAWMFNYGSWNYVFYIDMLSKEFEMYIVSIMILLAAMTKSAQIPFSSWLPAAMAAPTPVSSLVHSSTLVTAGVYLLIRFNTIFNNNMMLFLLFVSSLTMFMSGLAANFEFDLKKVIALSTLSQLGLMMSILSLGSFDLAFFHLLTHALFKALLFMCAGVIIHNLLNCQDIRYMGALSSSLPLTISLFNISNLSLCGIPFLSGFYSKDLILEVLSMNFIGVYVYIIFFISTGLTVCYSMRLMYYTLIGNFNFLSLNSIYDEDKSMMLGMLGLIVFVIIGGSILSWIMLATPMYICLPLLLKLMALVVTFVGVWIGYELSIFSLNYNSLSLSNFGMTGFISGMWNMPYISTTGVNLVPLKMGSFIYKSIDQGWSEIIGAQKIYLNLKTSSMFFQLYFNNNMKIFLMLMVFWIIFLILI